MRRRGVMCAECPFRDDRVGPPVPNEVMAEVDRRIAAGERWVCHQTCDGPRVTLRSSLCAGAPLAEQPGVNRQVRSSTPVESAR